MRSYVLSELDMPIMHASIKPNKRVSLYGPASKAIAQCQMEIAIIGVKYTMGSL